MDFPTHTEHVLFSAFYGKTYHKSASYDTYAGQAIKKVVKDDLPWHTITPDIHSKLLENPNLKNTAESDGKFIKLVINSMFYGALALVILLYLIDFMIFGKINLNYVIHLICIFFLVVLGYFKYTLTKILPPVEQLLMTPGSEYLFAINDRTEKIDEHIYANIRFDTGYTKRIVVNEAADAYIIIRNKKQVGIQPYFEENSKYEPTEKSSNL